MPPVKERRISPRPKTPKRPTPNAAWAKRRAEASLQIEKAALEFLAENDAADVTVEQIAKGAGISRRTFYRYFETTDDIIAAMPRRWLRRAMQSFRAQPSNETILDAFLAAMRKSAGVEEDLEIHRLTKRVRRRSPEVWTRAVRRVRAHGAEVLEEIVADKLRALGRDAAPAGVITATFMALLVQVPTESSRKGEEPRADDFERALRSLVEIVTEAKPARRRRATNRPSNKK